MPEGKINQVVLKITARSLWSTRVRKARTKCLSSRTQNGTHSMKHRGALGTTAVVPKDRRTVSVYQVYEFVYRV